MKITKLFYLCLPLLIAHRIGINIIFVDIIFRSHISRIDANWILSMDEDKFIDDQHWDIHVPPAIEMSGGVQWQ